MGVDALEDPAELEGLALRIFGDGDRPPGWFARKLRREGVDPALSVVALRPGSEPRDPNGWLGYVLVGTPPSLHPAARTSGTGVVPWARGRGLASRLLDAAAQRCRDAGLRRLQLLARAELVPFYRERGFASLRATVTALGFGEATHPRLVAAPPWRSPRAAERERVAWLPEAWAGTEAHARHGCVTTEDDAALTAWISREGSAWLVQRLLAPPELSLLAAADALRRCLPAGAPVLLPLLDADDPPTRALLEAGWAAAQRGALLERTLAP